ncbi:hypothetical protein ACFQHO_20055 [Actinomadura yumaensis]|uniref:hypothetical protein n=1 Tax=Actinomadura yumaensis TaxID=111807 RepID=UPI00362268CE
MDYTPPLTITGWVHISYGQYYLMAHGAGEPEPPTEDGLILSNEADEGSLYIASETQHGKIRLIVRVYDREPSLDSGEWDHIESSEIRAESADIDVIKWGGEARRVSPAWRTPDLGFTKFAYIGAAACSDQRMYPLRRRVTGTLILKMACAKSI